MYEFIVWYKVGGILHQWPTTGKSMDDAASKFKGAIVGITKKGFEVSEDEH